MIRPVLLFSVLTLLSCIALPGVYGAPSGNLIPSSSSVARLAVVKRTLPGDIEAYLEEWKTLNRRLVALLKEIKSEESFFEREDSLLSISQDIATLDFRYPDVPWEVMRKRKKNDEEIDRLDVDVNRELVRIGQESRSLLKDVREVLWEAEAVVYQNKEYRAKEEEFGTRMYEEIISGYERLLPILESLQTREDALRSFDTLFGIVGDIKDALIAYGMWAQVFLEDFDSDERVHSIHERMDLVVEQLRNDGDMIRALDALDPLLFPSSIPSTIPSKKEQLALKEYRNVVQRAIEIFRKIKTPEDVDTYANELLEIGEAEKKFNKLLFGYRGERLIEDDPELKLLLPELGVEQMRVLEDEKIGAKILGLFNDPGMEGED